MTDTIKISRELAEQICVELEHDNDRYMLCAAGCVLATLFAAIILRGAGRDEDNR